jgi:hypothetical protein
MTAMDALELLAGLSKRDRAWILRNLSEAAQRRLREQANLERANLDGNPGANMEGVARIPTPRPAGKDRASPKEDLAAADERAVEWLEGEQVAAALTGEPPWIVAALVGLRTWPWESQMLARIAPMTRLEVSQLRLSAPRVTEAMRRLLLSSLRARVAGVAASSATGFERLLQGQS